MTAARACFFHRQFSLFPAALLLCAAMAVPCFAPVQSALAQSSAAIDPATQRMSAQQRVSEMVRKKRDELSKMTPAEREKALDKERQSAGEERRKMDELRARQLAESQARQASAAVPKPPENNANSTTGTGTAMLPSCVLELRPFHQVIRPGQAFVTEARAYSASSFALDRVEVCIAYPRRLVLPVRVYDFPLSGLLDTSPTVTITDGMLRFSAQLRKPLQTLDQVPLFYVQWQAAGEPGYAALSLAKPGTPRESNSAIYLKDKNLLESNAVLNVAVVNAGVAVTPSASEDNSGSTILLDPLNNASAGADPAGRKPASSARCRLLLAGPEQAPAAGEEFVVEVLLDNPARVSFDDLRLAIRFDPAKVEVLDWDEDGWIKTGVNLYDAHAHALFPFNVHLANSVSNRLGRVTYQMGFTAPRATPSGCVAKIRCVAKEAGAEQAFELFPEGQTRDWSTDLRLGGASVLARLETGRREVSLSR